MLIYLAGKVSNNIMSNPKLYGHEQSPSKDYNAPFSTFLGDKVSATDVERSDDAMKLNQEWKTKQERYQSFKKSVLEQPYKFFPKTKTDNDDTLQDKANQSFLYLGLGKTPEQGGFFKPEKENNRGIEQYQYIARNIHEEAMSNNATTIEQIQQLPSYKKWETLSETFKQPPSEKDPLTLPSIAEKIVTLHNLEYGIDLFKKKHPKVFEQWDPRRKAEQDKKTAKELTDKVMDNVMPTVPKPSRIKKGEPNLTGTPVEKPHPKEVEKDALFNEAVPTTSQNGTTQNGMSFTSRPVTEADVKAREDRKAKGTNLSVTDSSEKETSDWGYSPEMLTSNPDTTKTLLQRFPQSKVSDGYRNALNILNLNNSELDEVLTKFDDTEQGKAQAAQFMMPHVEAVDALFAAQRTKLGSQRFDINALKKNPVEMKREIDALYKKHTEQKLPKGYRHKTYSEFTKDTVPTLEEELARLDKEEAAINKQKKKFDSYIDQTGYRWHEKNKLPAYKAIKTVIDGAVRVENGNVLLKDGGSVARNIEENLINNFDSIFYGKKESIKKALEQKGYKGKELNNQVDYHYGEAKKRFMNRIARGDGFVDWFMDKVSPDEQEDTMNYVQETYAGLVDNYATLLRYAETGYRNPNAMSEFRYMVPIEKLKTSGAEYSTSHHSALETGLEFLSEATSIFRKGTRHAIWDSRNDNKPYLDFIGGKRTDDESNSMLQMLRPFMGLATSSQGNRDNDNITGGGLSKYHNNDIDLVDFVTRGEAGIAFDSMNLPDEQGKDAMPDEYLNSWLSTTQNVAGILGSLAGPGKLKAGEMGMAMLVGEKLTAGMFKAAQKVGAFSKALRSTDEAAKLVARADGMFGGRAGLLAAFQASDNGRKSIKLLEAIGGGGNIGQWVHGAVSSSLGLAMTPFFNEQTDISDAQFKHAIETGAVMVPFNYTVFNVAHRIGTRLALRGVQETMSKPETIDYLNRMHAGVNYLGQFFSNFVQSPMIEAMNDDYSRWDSGQSFLQHMFLDAALGGRGGKEVYHRVKSKSTAAGNAFMVHALTKAEYDIRSRLGKDNPDFYNGQFNEIQLRLQQVDAIIDKHKGTLGDFHSLPIEEKNAKLLEVVKDIREKANELGLDEVEKKALEDDLFALQWFATDGVSKESMFSNLGTISQRELMDGKEEGTVGEIVGRLASNETTDLLKEIAENTSVGKVNVRVIDRDDSRLGKGFEGTAAFFDEPTNSIYIIREDAEKADMSGEDIVTTKQSTIALLSEEINHALTVKHLKENPTAMLEWKQRIAEFRETADVGEIFANYIQSQAGRNKSYNDLVDEFNGLYGYYVGNGDSVSDHHVYEFVAGIMRGDLGLGEYLAKSQLGIARQTESGFAKLLDKMVPDFLRSRLSAKLQGKAPVSQGLSIMQSYHAFMNEAIKADNARNKQTTVPAPTPKPAAEATKKGVPPEEAAAMEKAKLDAEAERIKLEEDMAAELEAEIDAFHKQDEGNPIKAVANQKPLQEPQTGGDVSGVFDAINSRSGAKFGVGTILREEFGANTAAKYIADKFKEPELENDVNRAKVVEALNERNKTKPNPHLAKDIGKASQANKFIALGADDSSTGAVQSTGVANSGKYHKDDVVFVSTNGNRPNRVPFNQPEIARAVAAKSSFIIDNKRDRERSFNIGEREVEGYLLDEGYIEDGDTGVFRHPEYVPYYETQGYKAAHKINEILHTLTDVNYVYPKLVAQFNLSLPGDASKMNYSDPDNPTMPSNKQEAADNYLTNMGNWLSNLDREQGIGRFLRNEKEHSDITAETADEIIAREFDNEEGRIIDGLSKVTGKTAPEIRRELTEAMRKGVNHFESYVEGFKKKHFFPNGLPSDLATQIETMQKEGIEVPDALLKRHKEYLSREAELDKQLRAFYRIKHNTTQIYRCGKYGEQADPNSTKPLVFHIRPLTDVADAMTAAMLDVVSSVSLPIGNDMVPFRLPLIARKFIHAFTANMKVPELPKDADANTLYDSLKGNGNGNHLFILPKDGGFISSLGVDLSDVVNFIFNPEHDAWKQVEGQPARPEYNAANRIMAATLPRDYVLWRYLFTPNGGLDKSSMPISTEILSGILSPELIVNYSHGNGKNGLSEQATRGFEHAKISDVSKVYHLSNAKQKQQLREWWAKQDKSFLDGVAKTIKERYYTGDIEVARPLVIEARAMLHPDTIEARAAKRIERYHGYNLMQEGMTQEKLDAIKERYKELERELAIAKIAYGSFNSMIHTALDPAGDTYFAQINIGANKFAKLPEKYLNVVLGNAYNSFRTYEDFAYCAGIPKGLSDTELLEQYGIHTNEYGERSMKMMVLDVDAILKDDDMFNQAFGGATREQVEPWLQELGKSATDGTTLSFHKGAMTILGRSLQKNNASHVKPALHINDGVTSTIVKTSAHLYDYETIINSDNAILSNLAQFADLHNLAFITFNTSIKQNGTISHANLVTHDRKPIVFKESETGARSMDKEASNKEYAKMVGEVFTVGELNPKLVIDIPFGSLRLVAAKDDISRMSLLGSDLAYHPLNVVLNLEGGGVFESSYAKEVMQTYHEIYDNVSKRNFDVIEGYQALNSAMRLSDGQASFSNANLMKAGKFVELMSKALNDNWLAGNLHVTNPHAIAKIQGILRGMIQYVPNGDGTTSPKLVMDKLGSIYDIPRLANPEGTQSNSLLRTLIDRANENAVMGKVPALTGNFHADIGDGSAVGLQTLEFYNRMREANPDIPIYHPGATKMFLLDNGALNPEMGGVFVSEDIILKQYEETGIMPVIGSRLLVKATPGDSPESLMWGYLAGVRKGNKSVTVNKRLGLGLDGKDGDGDDLSVIFDNEKMFGAGTFDKLFKALLKVNYNGVPLHEGAFKSGQEVDNAKAGQFIDEKNSTLNRELLRHTEDGFGHYDTHPINNNPLSPEYAERLAKTMGQIGGVIKAIEYATEAINQQKNWIDLGNGTYEVKDTAYSRNAGNKLVTWQYTMRYNEEMIRRNVSLIKQIGGVDKFVSSGLDANEVIFGTFFAKLTKNGKPASATDTATALKAISGRSELAPPSGKNIDKTKPKSPRDLALKDPIATVSGRRQRDNSGRSKSLYDLVAQNAKSAIATANENAFDKSAEGQEARERHITQAAKEVASKPSAMRTEYNGALQSLFDDPISKLVPNFKLPGSMTSLIPYFEIPEGLEQTSYFDKQLQEAVLGKSKLESTQRAAYNIISRDPSSPLSKATALFLNHTLANIHYKVPLKYTKGGKEYFLSNQGIVIKQNGTVVYQDAVAELLKPLTSLHGYSKAQEAEALAHADVLTAMSKPYDSITPKRSDMIVKKNLLTDMAAVIALGSETGRYSADAIITSYLAKDVKVSGVSITTGEKLSRLYEHGIDPATGFGLDSRSITSVANERQHIELMEKGKDLLDEKGQQYAEDMANYYNKINEYHSKSEERTEFIRQGWDEEVLQSIANGKRTKAIEGYLDKEGNFIRYHDRNHWLRVQAEMRPDLFHYPERPMDDNVDADAIYNLARHKGNFNRFETHGAPNSRYRSPSKLKSSIDELRADNYKQLDEMFRKAGLDTQSGHYKAAQQVIDNAMNMADVNGMTYADMSNVAALIGNLKYSINHYRQTRDMGRLEQWLRQSSYTFVNKTDSVTLANMWDDKTITLDPDLVIGSYWEVAPGGDMVKRDITGRDIIGTNTGISSAGKVASYSIAIGLMMQHAKSLSGLTNLTHILQQSRDHVTAVAGAGKKDTENMDFAELEQQLSDMDVVIKGVELKPGSEQYSPYNISISYEATDGSGNEITFTTDDSISKNFSAMMNANDIALVGKDAMGAPVLALPYEDIHTHKDGIEALKLVPNIHLMDDTQIFNALGGIATYGAGSRMHIEVPQPDGTVKNVDLEDAKKAVRVMREQEFDWQGTEADHNSYINNAVAKARQNKVGQQLRRTRMFVTEVHANGHVNKWIGYEEACIKDIEEAEILAPSEALAQHSTYVRGHHFAVARYDNMQRAVALKSGSPRPFYLPEAARRAFDVLSNSGNTGKYRGLTFDQVYDAMTSMYLYDAPSNTHYKWTVDADANGNATEALTKIEAKDAPTEEQIAGTLLLLKNIGFQDLTDNSLSSIGGVDDRVSSLYDQKLGTPENMARVKAEMKRLKNFKNILKNSRQSALDDYIATDAKINNTTVQVKNKLGKMVNKTVPSIASKTPNKLTVGERSLLDNRAARAEQLQTIHDVSTQLISAKQGENEAAQANYDTAKAEFDAKRTMSVDEIARTKTTANRFAAVSAYARTMGGATALALKATAAGYRQMANEAQNIVLKELLTSQAQQWENRAAKYENLSANDVLNMMAVSEGGIAEEINLLNEIYDGLEQNKGKQGQLSNENARKIAAFYLHYTGKDAKEVNTILAKKDAIAAYMARGIEMLNIQKTSRTNSLSQQGAIEYTKSTSMSNTDGKYEVFDSRKLFKALHNAEIITETPKFTYKLSGIHDEFKAAATAMESYNDHAHTAMHLERDINGRYIRRGTNELANNNILNVLGATTLKRGYHHSFVDTDQINQEVNLTGRSNNDIVGRAARVTSRNNRGEPIVLTGWVAAIAKRTIQFIDDNGQLAEKNVNVAVMYTEAPIEGEAAPGLRLVPLDNIMSMERLHQPKDDIIEKELRANIRKEENQNAIVKVIQETKQRQFAGSNHAASPSKALDKMSRDIIEHGTTSISAKGTILTKWFDKTNAIAKQWAYTHLGTFAGASLLGLGGVVTYAAHISGVDVINTPIAQFGTAGMTLALGMQSIASATKGVLQQYKGKFGNEYGTALRAYTELNNSNSWLSIRPALHMIKDNKDEHVSNKAAANAVQGRINSGDVQQSMVGLDLGKFENYGKEKKIIKGVIKNLSKLHDKASKTLQENRNIDSARQLHEKIIAGYTSEELQWMQKNGASVTIINGLAVVTKDGVPMDDWKAREITFTANFAHHVFGRMLAESEVTGVKNATEKVMKKLFLEQMEQHEVPIEEREELLSQHIEALSKSVIGNYVKNYGENTSRLMNLWSTFSHFNKSWRSRQSIGLIEQISVWRDMNKMMFEDVGYMERMKSVARSVTGAKLGEEEVRQVFGVTQRDPIHAALNRTLGTSGFFVLLKLALAAMNYNTATVDTEDDILEKFIPAWDEVFQFGEFMTGDSNVGVSMAKTGLTALNAANTMNDLKGNINERTTRNIEQTASSLANMTNELGFGFGASPVKMMMLGTMYAHMLATDVNYFPKVVNEDPVLEQAIMKEMAKSTLGVPLMSPIAVSYSTFGPMYNEYRQEKRKQNKPRR